MINAIAIPASFIREVKCGQLVALRDKPCSRHEILPDQDLSIKVLPPDQLKIGSSKTRATKLPDM